MRSRGSSRGFLGLIGLRGGVRLAGVGAPSLRELGRMSGDRSSIAGVPPGIGRILVAGWGPESSLETGGGNCRGKRGKGDRNGSDSCNGSENTDESTGRCNLSGSGG